MSALPLRAETIIRLHSPASVTSHLREHFGEHGVVAGTDHAWSVIFDIGRASVHVCQEGVAFRVEADDDTSLAFLQWSVAEHVCEFAPDEHPEIVWRGGTSTGAPLPYFREMTVVRSVQMTPAVRRLTLAGADLARFARNGLHVRLLLTPRRGVVPVWPVMAADGRQAWPEGERPVARVYTIRRIDVDAGEIDIDFVLHASETRAPGARFASEACPGDVIGMTGPGGGDLKTAAHYIFAGDETAQPAILRMLEELPADATAKAFLEVANASEIPCFPARKGIELCWISREGRPAGSTTLLVDRLRALDCSEWSDDFYIWAGCEHAAARDIRNLLRAERQLPKDRYLVAAYWRHGQSGEVVN